MSTEPHLPNWSHLVVEVFAVELGKLVTRQLSIQTTANVMAKLAAAVNVET